jgi:hypothetical protein
MHGNEDKGRNMTNKELKLIECFNGLFQIKPMTYNELNKTYNYTGELEKLHSLEKKYIELGLKGKDADKISVVSLFATITDIFCDKRLAFICDNESEIIKEVKLLTWEEIFKIKKPGVINIREVG